MSILTIGPAEIASYLRNANWHITESGRVAEVWASQDERNEVLVPKITTAPDFEFRLAILLQDLQEAESRDAASIRDEMSRQFVDVTDLRVEHPFADTVIPLTLGQRLFWSARKIVTASSAATLARRGYFGRSMPRKAREQASKVFIGHTKPGSYIVPVVSRAYVPAIPWQSEQPQLIEKVEYAAFDRRAMVTMSKALATLEQIAVRQERLPTIHQINDSVGEGVSYELCTSIKDVVETPEIQQFDIRFNWAPSLPASTGPHEVHVDFPPDCAPILRQICDTLRSDTADRPKVIYGVVVLLRSRTENEARVDIEALVDGKKRSIRLDLSPEDYSTAVSCHKRVPVVVRGVLHLQEGRQASMEVQSFEPDLSMTGIKAFASAR